MTFFSEANAKLCLDFFHRLRKDHPEESILFSPLNMSAALYLLHHGSRGESATGIEKELHLIDETKHLSAEPMENSEETESYDASEDSLRTGFTDDLHDSTEECIQDAEGNQDGIAQALSKPLAEDCEAEERPSVQDLLQSSETDASQMDRSLTHTSIPTDSQSTSDEGASASFLSWSKNISPEEAVDILSHEQPSPEGVASHKLVNTSKNQDGLVADINSSAEETKVASDNADTDTENIHNSSCVYPENHANGEGAETKMRTSSLVIHLVSEGGNKKPITKSHSVPSKAGTPQSDIANVLPKREDDKFLSQEQSSQDDHQNQMEPPESNRSMTFSDGRSSSFDTHSEAVREKLLKNPLHKSRHNINTRENKNTEAEDSISPQRVLTSDGIREAMNDLVQTLENSSSKFDSDDDVSSDFFPWSEDDPEKEVEIISQEESTPEDNVFDNEISSPENKQVSFLNSSDTPNPSCSFPGAEGTTRLNNGHIKKLKYPGNQTNSEESEGEEGNVLPDTKTIHRKQPSTSGHKTEYSLTYAEFAIRSSYDLPWTKYLLGREQREALRQAGYQVLENLAEPLECRMYNYIPRI